MPTKSLLQVLAACLFLTGVALLVIGQIHHASYEDLFFDELGNEVRIGQGTTFVIRAFGVLTLLNAAFALLAARKA